MYLATSSGAVDLMAGVRLQEESAQVELRVKRAAAYIRDALVGRFSGSEWAAASERRVRLKLLFHRLKFLRVSVSVLFVAISFFEQVRVGTSSQCVSQLLAFLRSYMVVTHDGWGGLLEVSPRGAMDSPHACQSICHRTASTACL
jgi:hypothetical protein